MKSGIHPNWNHNAVITCACGNSFTTGSTLDTIAVDICSKCHPFFTGELRFVDRQGRIDQFMQKMQTAAQKQAAKKSKTKGDEPAQPEGPAKSYQEILLDQQKQLKKAAATQKVANAAA